ncbi:MAG: efflux RND transporter periplasmic adaptor subunit [Thermoanaerobaculia bacterium]
MKKWLLRVSVVAISVVALFLLRTTFFAPEELVVEVQEVGLGRVESTITNSRAGSVRARNRAKLSPEIGGYVVEISHREGESVEAGDVLLRLNNSSQLALLELRRREQDTANAEKNRSCLAADRAGRELRRMEQLADDEIVSADVLDGFSSASQTAEAACQAATANVARARAAATVARIELNKTVLRAPFAGVVAEVSIEIGEWTTPSPPALPVPPVIDVLDPESIYVSAPMDEIDSAKIRVGQPARITVDSYRDLRLEGRVSRISPYVLDLQEQNRTVEVEVEFIDDEFAANLLPGTSADVEIILEVNDGVIRIPTSALMEGSRVLVLVDRVLEERTVEIGLRNWDFSEILNGIEERELLVTSLDRPEVKAGARAVLDGR